MFSLRLMPRRLAGALAILAAVAAGSATTALAQQITAETVIATVNGTPITAGELQLAGAEFADQLGQVPADRRDAAVLDLVINMRLASAAATTAGLDKDPVVAERLDLARNRTLYSEFLRDKFLAAVTPEAVQARYDAEMASYQPQEEVHARHILVNTDQEDLAKEIIAELDAGGDFAKIAAEKSQDPGSGASGGDLGWFKRGMMVKPFEDAAFALEPGQYTKTPVKSDFGWHVILVEEKRIAPPPTLEQERPRIEQEIVRDTFDSTINALREGASIEFATLPGAAEPPAGNQPPAAAEPPAEGGEAPAEPAE